jgi:hypothetical protein
MVEEEQVEDDEDKMKELDLEVVLNTYAVNKTIEQNLKCFLCLNEKYLIERDETNTKCLNFFHCIDLIDGSIDKRYS